MIGHSGLPLQLKSSKGLCAIPFTYESRICLDLMAASYLVVVVTARRIRCPQRTAELICPGYMHRSHPQLNEVGGFIKAEPSNSVNSVSQNGGVHTYTTD